MKKYFYELMMDKRHGLIDKIIQAVLWILSLGYCLMVALTRLLYQKGFLSVYESPRPVVSIGNITSGGVGKTPLVIWLAKVYHERQVKVVVLSRGYGSVEGLNDETKMFQELLPQVPIVIGSNRKESIRKIFEKWPVDIFLADDAFQHWPLKRDLDIVTVDAAYPFGNGHLLPRGILREKPSALERADIFVLTKTDKVQSTQELCNQLHQINPGALVVKSRHVPRRFHNFEGHTTNLEILKGQKVLAFCAIGDPSSFEHTLQQLGLVVSKVFTFVDHHHYSEDDLQKVVNHARKENIKIIVTTHKDDVKITPFRNVFYKETVLILDIELEITQGQDELIQRVLSLRRR
ncbi:MAG: tetraacyldisaccharide 4'-kinase [Candidatus Omnitrophica bacterium]|nr:tetraacyldisaccharide 4'-kinase [Candidatus Omnitrophota bacterium]